RLENENILLIEFDPQCNITEKFIPAQFLNRTNNIYDLIESENDPNIELSSTELKEAIFDFSDNFHFIPSSLKLGRADNWKSDELASLHNLLHNPFFTQNYSIIIIDVVPTIGNMLIIPLLASDYVIMPTQAEEMSIQGLQSSINILEKMKKINTELKLFGILVTMTQSNTNIQADEIKNIKDMSENLVFKTTIPRNISVQEAFKRAMFLDQHDMASPASIAYNSLFEEIVERLNNG
ncbi:MAG: ParA family protein, partial [Flavobacteriales bacterium]|nr:ParA family protein [Flavobacteriales bacterium]